MATSHMTGFIQELRRALLVRDGAGRSDGQLLTDYISRRDDAALAVLVRRHGPMVWGVCRRVLRNCHDAEDAFQATFLVLVRKVASITSRELVANWLYGVAYQTALKARTTTAKRKGRERQVTNMPEAAVSEQGLCRDLQNLLVEELSRLPEKYRSVIVLCDLEGKTRKDVARQLGVPLGTVGGWLARAKRTLAKRLAQRGVVLSSGALAVALSQNRGSAGVPTWVVSSTIKAARLLGAGQLTATEVVSPKIAALAEGVLKTMLMNKIKRATVILTALAALVGGSVEKLHVQAASKISNEESTLGFSPTTTAAVSGRADNAAGALPVPAPVLHRSKANAVAKKFPRTWAASTAYVKRVGDKGLRVQAEIPMFGFVKMLDARGKTVSVNRFMPWQPPPFTVEAKRIRVYDARGGARTEKEWIKAFAEESLVLLEFRDDEINPQNFANAYRLYRDDLLVLVLPTAVLTKDLDMSKAFPPVNSLPQTFPGSKPGPGDPIPPAAKRSSP